MPDPLADAREAMDRTAAALVGRRIRQVTYYGLSDDPDWDLGGWHLPVMGVEFRLDDDTPYSAVWGDVFGSFGLEVYASPMTDYVVGSEYEGGDTNRWSVTDHPRWAAVLPDPVTNARLVWKEGYADRMDDLTVPAPLALRLDFPTGTVRLIAAMESTEGRWWLGADEVIVAFTDEFTAHIGYPEHD